MQFYDYSSFSITPFISRLLVHLVLISNPTLLYWPFRKAFFLSWIWRNYSPFICKDSRLSNGVYKAKVGWGCGWHHSPSACPLGAKGEVLALDCLYPGECVGWVVVSRGYRSVNTFSSEAVQLLKLEKWVKGKVNKNKLRPREQAKPQVHGTKQDTKVGVRAMTSDAKVDFEQGLGKGIQEIPPPPSFGVCKSPLGVNLHSPKGLTLYFINHRTFTPPFLIHSCGLLETVSFCPLIQSWCIHQASELHPFGRGPCTISYPGFFSSLLSSSPSIPSPQWKPRFASPIYIHAFTPAHTQ